jgi:hypothetical protein
VAHRLDQSPRPAVRRQRLVVVAQVLVAQAELVGDDRQSQRVDRRRRLVAVDGQLVARDAGDRIAQEHRGRRHVLAGEEARLVRGRQLLVVNREGRLAVLVGAREVAAHAPRERAGC